MCHTARLHIGANSDECRAVVRTLHSVIPALQMGVLFWHASTACTHHSEGRKTNLCRNIATLFTQSVDINGSHCASLCSPQTMTSHTHTSTNTSAGGGHQPACRLGCVLKVESGSEKMNNFNWIPIELNVGNQRSRCHNTCFQFGPTGRQLTMHAIRIAIHLHNSETCVQFSCCMCSRICRCSLRAEWAGK